ncbi:MAG: DUF3592 domain-containing protein [Bacillota bacterium]
MTARSIERSSDKGPAQRREAGGCLAPLIFLVVLLAGVLIFYFVFWEPVSGAIESARWVKTPCVIVTSQIEVFRPGGKESVPVSKEDRSLSGKRFVPSVRYAYRYNNTLYHSTRIWFVRPAFNTLHEAEEIVERYPKGQERVCYVAPERPASSVLERGFKPDLLIALIPLGLAVGGLIGLAATVGPWVIPLPMRERWRKRQLRAEETTRRRRGRRRVYAPGGPFSFRPHHDGRGLAILIVIAIVWNAMMIFLVQEVIDTWRGGIPELYGWALTLFAIPLLLVGVALVIPPGYFLLKLLRPRPTLILSSATVALGGEISVGWKIWANGGRIRRLRIFVEGREEATYTRGTNAYTDYEVFAIVPVADTTLPSEIRGGRKRLRIPKDTMPTFCSEHNKIVWALRIHGQMGIWPDVDEEFELQVVAGESHDWGTKGKEPGPAGRR